MFYRATFVTMALVCSACGDGPEAPILLIAPELPSCFVSQMHIQQALATGGAGPGSTSGSLTIPGRAPGLGGDAFDRMMRETRLTTLLNMAAMMVAPVVADPTASTWESSRALSSITTVRIEGESIARDEHSGRFAMRMWNDASAPSTTSLEVAYRPDLTIYDFGSIDRFEVTARRIRSLTFELGCGSADISYVRAPGSVGECWHSNGKLIDAQTCFEIIQANR